MTNTEVQRLRRLRNVALRTRALALALESRPAPRSSLQSRSAVACWLIARVVTGRLRAHPYLSYQRGPSGVRRAYAKIIAAVIGPIARRRGRASKVLAGELHRVARELADARALTWSADLGDSFGRSQAQIERLIDEAAAGVRNRTVPHSVTSARVHVENNAGNIAANWPYLTF